MYIELLDVLRCTSDHAQIPLVTAITERDGRFVVDATMGCPTCRREFRIESGVALFSDARRRPANSEEPVVDPEAAMRIAALLGVTEGGTYAMTGEWASLAPRVAELVAARVYAVNSQIPLEESELTGSIVSATVLPFAQGTLRGVALGGPLSGDTLQSALNVLAPGGRMVAPAGMDVPASVSEIARDESLWVGEKRGPLVTLHRR